MNKLFKQSTIKIKNVTYFRDLGGIATIDGKHIKHGLIYKTSHLASIDDEAKDIIESLGGKTVDSVSKKTSVVIVGANPGSKYTKAKELNIEVWSEEEFKEKF